MSHDNPTDCVSLDFAAYTAARSGARSAHLIQGTPDYAFSLDKRLRQRLASIGPLRHLARFLVRTHEPFMQQLTLMKSIAVGPTQLPEIFEAGQHCARLLGIGVPRIFVQPSEELNAYTFASDDVTPSIVLTSSMLRALSPDELKAVIGHECGHIHNLHNAYNTLVVLIANEGARSALGMIAAQGGSLPLVKQLAQLTSWGLRLFLARWSRCAEVTSDRAGAICAGSVAPMIRALVKLATRGEAELEGIDVDAYVRQLDAIKNSIWRLTELGDTHPLLPKRIEALRLFHNSETFLSWRPELKCGDPIRSASEVDSACERLISVVDTGRTYTEKEAEYELRR
jgi:Zn-dependent protease with chaperone function